MAREATIEIASMDGGQLLVRLLKSAVPYPGMHKYIPLAIDASTLPSLTNSTSVIFYGQALRNALCSHGAVGFELQQLFLTQPPGVASLDFSIAAPEAEALRWETLCEKDPPDFWALNGSRHLKRVVPPTLVESFGLRMFSQPVRMAAFLSPAAVKSRGEFEAISEAVQAARGKGLNIEAIFYLGEQDLIDEKRAEIQAGKLSGVQVRPMPSDSISIENALKNDPAHIVHFFCHGHVSAGVQLLEFASINDHDTEALSGSVQLSIERLSAVLAGVGIAWLTVLNSCSGAQSVPRLWSMAGSLAGAASPVVIGMAEPILNDDATLFAQGFYSQAFDSIGDAISGLQQGNVTSIELGAALASARSKLHAAALLDVASHQAAGQLEPSTFGRWSLPIMYQREGGLRVAHVEADVRKRIETVAQALRSLPSDTPVELRDDILSLLDKEPAAPAGLRPDRLGNLK